MNNILKNTNKTAIAMMFSVIGASASMSAVASIADELHAVHEEEHKIEIIKKDDEKVKLFVSVNGDVTNVELPEDALTDKAQLEAALANVPEDVRQKVLDSLGNINVDAKVFKVKSRGGQHANFNWVTDSDQENVFVVEIDEEQHGDKVAHKIIKHINVAGGGDKVFQFKHGKVLGADIVIKLLEKGEFTQDDLNNIQQALDAKR